MRWEICFNLSVLRMLSYALDLHWRRRQLAGPPRSPAAGAQQQQQKEQQKEGQGSGKAQDGPAQQQGEAAPGADAAPAPRGGAAKAGPEAAALWRQQTPLPAEEDYGLLMCLAHVLYVPLYLAGPIITFQDFAWQLRHRDAPPLRKVRRRGVHACLPASWDHPSHTASNTCIPTSAYL